MVQCFQAVCTHKGVPFRFTLKITNLGKTTAHSDVPFAALHMTLVVGVDRLDQPTGRIVRRPPGRRMTSWRLCAGGGSGGWATSCERLLTAWCGARCWHQGRAIFSCANFKYKNLCFHCPASTLRSPPSLLLTGSWSIELN